MLNPGLYIVPTPIGNLKDITLRAIEVLQNATLIAAEDTRHTRTLLDHIGSVSAKLISCHDHNEEERVEFITNEVKKGGIVALVSDAGTPLISDPGYKLIVRYIENGVNVYPLPGACAAITALEGAALPTDRFIFEGFLPVKDKELREKITGIKNNNVTTIVYESPRRVLNTCKILAEIMPDNDVCLCRELTKTFESFYRKKAKDLVAFLSEDENRQRGEFVIIIGPHKEADKQEIPDSVLKTIESLAQFVPSKLLASSLSDLTGISKKDIYNEILKIKE